jgi:hypothetical protein
MKDVMNKVIKLTELELNNLIKKIILEIDMSKTDEDKSDENRKRHLKRRIPYLGDIDISYIEEVIDNNIKHAESEGHTFSNEYTFASNIILWILQDLDLHLNPNIDSNEVEDFIKDRYGDYILSHYSGYDEYY